MSETVNTFRVSEIRAKWGWFVALGILLLVFGIIALGNLLVATVASVYVVGMLMIVGAIIHLVHAFQVKGWSDMAYWALSGLLYLAAGILAFVNPILTSAVLTLLMAAALLVSGIFRIWIGIRSRELRGWGWIVASGIVSGLAGLIIMAGWPVNSLWVLGLFLAFDLLMQGWSMIAFGIMAKS
ncbi:HdeD family acid-resistance protein [Sinorhizobium sp. BG8]|uniref:HdeD family acid-resistance protein n=1 Tax=Sinorhizobium sp. BG8 TaxID=2613773 RepID=UPI00193C8EDA|nr:HdeD family acid-resistance protein [Sinorhizobium sp. BG8]QRM54627.1 HdeD family acid-resistance protein [Sinorhizobium sp. BG8]